jgi:hypothetical protein
MKKTEIYTITYSEMDDRKLLLDSQNCYKNLLNTINYLITTFSIEREYEHSYRLLSALKEMVFIDLDYTVFMKRNFRCSLRNFFLESIDIAKKFTEVKLDLTDKLLGKIDHEVFPEYFPEVNDKVPDKNERMERLFKHYMDQGKN